MAADYRPFAPTIDDYQTLERFKRAINLSHELLAATVAHRDYLAHASTIAILSTLQPAPASDAEIERDWAELAADVWQGGPGRYRAMT